MSRAPFGAPPAAALSCRAVHISTHAAAHTSYTRRRPRRIFPFIPRHSKCRRVFLTTPFCPSSYVMSGDAVCRQLGPLSPRLHFSRTGSHVRHAQSGGSHHLVTAAPPSWSFHDLSLMFICHWSFPGSYRGRARCQPDGVCSKFSLLRASCHLLSALLDRISSDF